jgi:rubrerythrin
MCCTGEDEKRELLRDILPDQEPDKIDAAQRMLALAWRCDNCGHVTNSKVPIKIPAPCVQCGATVFRVVNR